MRRRILLLAVGMTTLVVLAFAIPLMFLTRAQIAQRAEASVTQQAFNLANTISAIEPSDAQLRRLIEQADRSGDHPVSVLLPDGRTIQTKAEEGDPDDTFPTDTPHESRPKPPSEKSSSSPTRIPPAQLKPVTGGEVAVAFASTSAGPYVVQVFLSNDKHYEGLTGWYSLIIGASIGLIMIGIVAGELLTRRITRPLVRTAETAQRLSTGDITARAPTNGPREVAGVGIALNRLADRIDELIVEERETVADLSHRLRTPLTTLRLEAEALRDPAEAERIGTRVSELERMLTAVIRAARRPQREGRMPSCDAALVVRERVAFWSALIEEQGRASAISVPEQPVPVRASAEDLAAAVDALLENVVAHTPEGTALSVSLLADDTGIRLEIADDGPGIPEEAEVRGRSDRGSSGLGLDIARRCAEAGGGAMTIGSSPSGGALVTLRFRAA